MHRRSAIFLLACLTASCNTKLETGYEPTKLGSLSPAQRRGLYAQDFTPEARAAEADKSSNNNAADYHSHIPGGNE